VSGLWLRRDDADKDRRTAYLVTEDRLIRTMLKLICQLMGRHRPALVVVGFADDHPVTASVCPHCGKRRRPVV
jgi:hypothetical protein